MSVRKDTIQGVKWSAVGQFSNTIVTFLLGIVLARLLSPSDYGIVGMTYVFIAIAGVFADGGFGSALIRKKDLTALDSSTVFYFNIVASIIVYLILFVSSPAIAGFLRTPILQDIIRVSGLNMVFASLGSIHFSLMTKKVNFKTPSILNTALCILQAIIGIYMAYSGMGVWALVWPNFIVCVLRSISVWFISSWRPLWAFSWKSFKDLFSFGGNLVVNSILDKLYNEGTSMLIGRYYTPHTLGFYTKGSNNAKMPSTFLYNIVGGVTYPVLAKIQDDDKTLEKVYSRYIRILSMVIFFMMIMLASLAKPYIVFLYSEKWEPAVIFLQLFCIRYLLYHVHAVNWNLLLVKGRSDYALKKEIINKTVKFSLLIASIPFGVMAICLAQIASSIIDLFVNTYYAGKVSSMGFRKQISDFGPYLILAIATCAPAYAITYLEINNLLSLVSGFLISMTLYCGYLWWCKDESFLTLIELTPINRILHKSTNENV